MKIGIGNDHSAVEMKWEIKTYMEEMGHEVVNYGVDTTESCNYPEIGEKVGRAVAAGEVECAILICGTGVGISLAANKVNGVRAAVCSDTTTAHLVREHNHANILAFGARIVGIEKAKDLVKAYLEAKPLGGRHAERVAMISEIEKRSSATE
jgi:ribose 5-phosphate isomerase B